MTNKNIHFDKEKLKGASLHSKGAQKIKEHEDAIKQGKTDILPLPNSKQNYFRKDNVGASFKLKQSNQIQMKF